MPRIRADSIAEHKELTRRQILEATEDLIAELGSADFSLGEVASAVGIGRTTLYDYFTDRDDVIASLVEEELPGVMASLLAGVDHDATPPERLAEVSERTVRFVATDPVFGLILHREVGKLSEDAQTRIRVAHQGLVREVGEIYRSGVGDGSLRAMPMDLAGRFIQDTIMSAAAAVIADEDPERRLPEIVAGMRTFLLGGLATR